MNYFVKKRDRDSLSRFEFKTKKSCLPYGKQDYMIIQFLLQINSEAVFSVYDIINCVFLGLHINIE